MEKPAPFNFLIGRPRGPAPASDPRPQSSLHKQWRRVVLALTVTVGALPLLVSDPAPLQDWPGHLARVHILDRLLRGDAFWSRFYSIGSFDVPNMALDAGVLGLMRAGLPEGRAAQGFLLLTYCVFISGFCLLARRFGRVGIGRVAVGALLFTCSPLYWGLVNYVFATGAMMLLLAAWLGARRPLARLGIAVAGATGLFFCHLVAAGAFAGIIACFEGWETLSNKAAWRRKLIDGLTGFPALAVVLILMRIAPHRSVHDVHYAHADSPWAFLRWKAIIFAQLPIGGPLLGDLLLGAMGAAIAILAALAGPPVRLPRGAWVPVAALTLLALASPEMIDGGSLFDERLAYLPALMVGATLQVAWRRPPKLSLEGLLVTASLLHAAILAQGWRSVGGEFARYDQAVATLAPGSIMLTAYGTASNSVHLQRFWAEPYKSIGARAAYHNIFVPTVFANPVQQPVAVHPEFEALHYPVPMSSDEEVRAAAAKFAALCGADTYSGVAVTVIYPARVFAEAALYATPDVLILDGCRFAAAYGALGQ
jgi:hypothetical protein